MIGDLVNVYMIAYLEAGKDYYINIAYVDVYQEGTISFRIDRLGDEGSYRFSLASLPYYDNIFDDNGNSITLSGGIPIVLGDDGYWHEKRDDGRIGSIIYADFSSPTCIFTQSLSRLIESGAFDDAGDTVDVLRTYFEKIIKVGDQIQVVNADGTGYETIIVEEGNPMVGCVAVDEQLAEALQMLMDRYVIEGVEYSWAKLCYYHQYFCAATPF
jgi:hypothetical protein